MVTVDVTVLNPKSMQISELYGAINTDTLEFSDGMVGKIGLKGGNFQLIFSLQVSCDRIRKLMNLKWGLNIILIIGNG